MTDQNKNLVLRALTVVVLLPLVLWLLWLGGLPFTLLIAAAASAAAFELNQLPGLGKTAAHTASAQGSSVVITGATLISAGAAFLLPLLHQSPLGLLTPGSVLMGVVVLAFLDALFFEEDLTKAPVRVGLAVLGALYAGLSMSALVRLRALQDGAYWVVLTLGITWMNDTGAYFAGRAFGRHKLFVRISPSKTWEGAVGGLLASILGAVLVQALFLTRLPLPAAAAIGAAAGVVGPLGDLSESMLKRAFGAKDSGTLLPGHGGMLDRIDALLFTAPLVWLCAHLLGL